MTSTDDSHHGGPGPRPRTSPSDGSSAGFPPQFEFRHRERNFRPPHHPGASSRATWHAPSREELSARKRSVLQSIQAEVDVAVAELEERRLVSRIQRRQSRMNSRPEAFDANYVGLEEDREEEEDIEALCDILLEEYGVEVEPLPPGARPPIYGPTVRPAWPVTTEEGVERERERRRSRKSRESRHELDSSENEASEDDDEELVESMSRGPADRLMAQTSLRGTYGGYKRPSRRHDPYDNDSYDAPSRPRPKPGGPGPSSPTGEGAAPSMEEAEARERKRDWEREREWEMMREREMRRERDLRREAGTREKKRDWERERDREMMREREMRREAETREKKRAWERDRDMMREREMRRDELDREMAKRQRAENEEEWEDIHRHNFVRMSPTVVTRNPPSEPRDDHTRRSHSEYDIRHTESRREPCTGADRAYEAGHRSGVEIRRRRRPEDPGLAFRSRSRSRSRPRSPPYPRDVYMHGARHADDAPELVLRDEESDDGLVRMRV
ncbi:hypothetical protein IFR05_015568 [Cadophora sp. M221]|nr:hypothetical protein IFR05_015568 [Cadophora sp. M221]